MKKMRVTEYRELTHSSCISFEKSHIGSDYSTNHPLIKLYNSSVCFKGIEVGDLLRCDGLPNVGRPIKIKGYKPFQLESKFWVLRAI